MLLDISFYNKLPLHEDWYPNVDIKTNGFPNRDEIDSFLEGLDVVFFCETPLNYYLIEKANQLGIATICQFNFEFLDHLNNPGLPAQLSSLDRHYGTRISLRLPVSRWNFYQSHLKPIFYKSEPSHKPNTSFILLADLLFMTGTVLWISLKQSKYSVCQTHAIPSIARSQRQRCVKLSLVHQLNLSSISQIMLICTMMAT